MGGLASHLDCTNESHNCRAVNPFRPAVEFNFKLARYAGLPMLVSQVKIETGSRLLVTA